MAKLAAIHRARMGRGHCQNHLAQLHMRLHPPARADADKGFRPVLLDQLIHINRKRRHTHAGAMHGDGVAVPAAGPALHAAHLVHQAGIGQEALRHPARAARIARQKHGFGNVALFGVDMRGHKRPF